MKRKSSKKKQGCVVFCLVAILIFVIGFIWACNSCLDLILP